MRAGALRGNGAGDAAGAAPHLEDTGRMTGAYGRVDTLESGIHEHLRLGTRDKHALLAAQDDVPKGHFARDVL